jgi:tetratricopeptide (TPR) repeat protein
MRLNQGGKMLENKCAKQYLKALYSSNRPGLVPLAELASNFEAANIEHPLVELRFLRQCESVRKGFKLAIGALAGAREDAPTETIAELIEAAEECYCNCEAAERELPELAAAVQDDPYRGEKLARLGFALNALEERAPARAAFIKALENTAFLSFYAHRDCVNNIGWDHFMHGEYEEALAWFEHAARFGEVPAEEGSGPAGPMPETSARAPYHLAFENVLLALAKLGRVAEAAKGVEDYHYHFGRLPVYERLALQNLGLEPDVMFMRSRIAALSANLEASKDPMQKGGTES